MAGRATREGFKLVFWAGFWTFLCDQLTKYVVVHAMDLRTLGRIEVWEPYFEFRMAWNPGVNFGLFSRFDMRWALIAVALVIVAFVLWWLRKEGGTSRWTFISGGLLIGGALGNVVDRVLYVQGVADFLNVTCCGIENPYAFNVADAAIFLGAIGMVIFGGERKPAKSGNKTP